MMIIDARSQFFIFLKKKYYMYINCMIELSLGRVQHYTVLYNITTWSIK